MSAAKQRQERSRLIGIAIFILFVIVSGFILTATHNTEDPFANMSDIVDMRQMLAETQQGGIAPAGGDLTSATLPNASRNTGITLSAFGDVLYDLWFICATTAVFIVFSYLIKWLVGLLSPKRLPPVAKRQRGEGPPVV